MGDRVGVSSFDGEKKCIVEVQKVLEKIPESCKGTRKDSALPNKEKTITEENTTPILNNARWKSGECNESSWREEGGEEGIEGDQKTTGPGNECSLGGEVP